MKTNIEKLGDSNLYTIYQYLFYFSLKNYLKNYFFIQNNVLYIRSFLSFFQKYYNSNEHQALLGLKNYSFSNKLANIKYIKDNFN